MKMVKSRGTPKIKVCVMIVKGGNMLMGKTVEGQGRVWGFPGAHLMAHETFEEVAHLSVMKQTSIDISPGSVLYTTNDIYINDYPKHDVTVYMDAKMIYPDAKPVPMGSFEEWQWFKLFHPPENITASARSFFSKQFVCIDNEEDWDMEFFGEDRKPEQDQKPD